MRVVVAPDSFKGTFSAVEVAAALGRGLARAGATVDHCPAADGGGLNGARLLVLCDVRTPWERCAGLYGPQKGADPALVRRQTDRLDRLAGELPRDPRGVPGGGAAGGLAGGL